MLQYNCGSKTNYNSTYFMNDGYPSTFNTIGQCSISVEKVNTDVCQLRLDFDELELSQEITVKSEPVLPFSLEL